MIANLWLILRSEWYFLATDLGLKYFTIMLGNSYLWLMCGGENFKASGPNFGESNG